MNTAVRTSGRRTLCSSRALLLGAIGVLASAQAFAVDVLIFSRTEGFRHSSIADGIALISTLAGEEGFTVQTTEDNTFFTPENLAGFDVVVWLSTTGDVLDADQEGAFEGFIEAGGGYVGIHAAADCEYGWPWYGGLLGGDAWFASHPAQQDATVVLESLTHPGAGTFAATTTLREEWYNFQSNPRPSIEVILTLDESTYDPGVDAMGDDHPIAWAHEYDGGRAFYTGLGHRSETYNRSDFKEQIRGALLWASNAGGGSDVFADGFESGNTSAWSPASQRHGGGRTYRTE